MGQQYQVRVRGPLAEEVRDQLSPLRVVADDASTLLVGVAEDQAALHGLLVRLRALGVEVVEVDQVPGSSA